MESNLTGGQLLFNAAHQYGITHVFGNPGTTEVNFMNALSQSPQMQFFLCLQEAVATGAADGFARIKGSPAMVNLHLAPGLTNGMSNIHNAMRARVPMIVTVGDHHTGYLLEDSALAGDIVGIAGSMCKWAWRVSRAEEIPAALHRAMLKAMTPPQGPVCLALPNNLLSTVTNEPVSSPPLQIPRPGYAHPEAISEAVERLKKAQKPMFILGDVKSSMGRMALLCLARKLNATILREPFPTRLDPSLDPIPVTNQARLPYPPKQRREILATSDCIVLVGVSNFTGLFMYDDDPVPELLPHSIPVIHLDSDMGELGKNARSAIPLLGDVDLTLLELQNCLEATEFTRESSDNDLPAPFEADDAKPLTSQVLGQALRASVPVNTIFVDESITAGLGIWAGLVNNNRQLSHVLTGRGGALGYGLPNAIGAKLAAPDKPVLAIIGDGTAVYTIQALWTLARYKLPVVTIICSNRNYDIITIEILRAQGQLAKQGVPKIMEYTGLNHPPLNFAALAQGFGLPGRQISKPSELVPALQEAFAANEPIVLDVAIASILRG